MEDKTTVIIDIQLDDAQVADRLAAVNKEMADLRSENAKMRKDVKEGTKTWEEVSVALADNEARLKTLKAEQSALSGQVAQSTQKNRQYGTSLKEQSALLNDLRSRYQSLSEEQRNSAGGKAMLKQIQDLDAKMKGADGTIGLFQRNVGDYANQVAKISGLFGSAGGAASSLTGQLGLVTKGMGALAATPLIGILTLLVTVVQKVVQAMKGSEEQTMKWKEIMAAFEPLVVAMKNGLTAFAGILVKVVGKAVEMVTDALHGLAKAADWVGSIFGADWGLTEKTEQMQAQAAAQRELTRAENEYIINKRAWGVESAKIDREVADLRAKTADKERYTAQEREQYLKRAMDLEEQKAAREKELAEQNLKNLQARAAQTANDAEMNDKLAEAERAVIEADTRLSETQRNLTKEMNRLHNEIRQEGQQAWSEYVAKIKEAREQCKGFISELKKINLTDLEDPIEKATEALISLNKAEKEAVEYQKNLTETIAASYGDLDEFAERLERQSNPLYNFAQKYEENAQLIKQTSSALQSSFGSVAAMYKQMAEDETKTEEERAAAARKAKTWAAIQIAANAGTAVAKGVASAVDVGFPAAIPAMATMLAAILAAIAQAKALAADTQGFETGGVIGGFRGATMGHDDTIITARKGEMFLNASQQRELFNIANGGSPSVNMAAQLAAAIAAMPAPVLEYSEFTRFTGRVADLEEITKIK